MGKIISVSNQKGGVGKTTTALNLSACLGILEQKVLLIDLDPQANATSGIGIDLKKNKFFNCSFIYRLTLNGKRHAKKKTEEESLTKTSILTQRTSSSFQTSQPVLTS